jgi:PPOX class probable F420-dependent enzyme
VSVREQIRMSDEEISQLLAQPHKLQLATINADGTPHLVSMYYAPEPGNGVSFWTYRTSQKAVNLERDPRCTALVETGEGYDQLVGVQLVGEVEATDDVDEVLAIGTRVYGRYLDGGLPEGMDDFLLDQAKKRRAFHLRVRRTASWDHRKLMAAHAAG